MRPGLFLFYLLWVLALLNDTRRLASLNNIDLWLPVHSAWLGISAAIDMAGRGDTAPREPRSQFRAWLRAAVSLGDLAIQRSIC